MCRDEGALRMEYRPWGKHDKKEGTHCMQTDARLALLIPLRGKEARMYVFGRWGWGSPLRR